MGKRNDVTIYDIAGALNLSTSTISRALNDSNSVREQTRSMIKRVAVELGYQRNRLVRNPESQGVNVLGAMVTHINTTIASSVLAGAESITAEIGYGLIVHQSMNNPEVRSANLMNFKKHNIGGVLITSTYFQEFPLLDQLSGLNVPSVIIEASSFLPSRPKKQVGDFQNAFELTNILMEKGCRKITYIATGLDQLRHERFLSGYQKSLQNHGASIDPFNSQSCHVQNSWLNVYPTLVDRSAAPDGIIFCNNVITAVAFCSPEKAPANNSSWAVTCRKGNISSQNQRLVELGKIAAALLVGLGRRSAIGQSRNVTVM